jgi:hypothetical protein
MLKKREKHEKVRTNEKESLVFVEKKRETLDLGNPSFIQPRWLEELKLWDSVSDDLSSNTREYDYDVRDFE